MEAMVDQERHPTRGKIRTVRDDETAPEGLAWNVKAALALLVVFVVALPVAGIVAALAGPWWASAPLGLAASTLTASLLVGNE